MLPHGKVMILENIYYYTKGNTPTSKEIRYQYEIGTEDEALPKTLKITTVWTPLKRYFMEAVGLIRLVNDEGKFLVIPTKEQRQEMAMRIIQVGVTERISHPAVEPEPKVVTFAQIRPGHGLRIEPDPSNQYWVRSKWGIIKASAVLYPGGAQHG